jgi:hypothetical protein
MGSVVSGLQAALLLARGRVEGLHHLEADMAGALRSFWALPLALPAAVCMRLIDWVETGPPADPGHTLGLDLMVFVVGWLGFAALTFELVRYLGVADRWPAYIAAWNWCNVVENVLVVAGFIPGLLGAPAVVDEASQLFALGWALWIEWFATRQTLRTNGLVAAWLVVLDQAIALVLAALTYRLMHG